MIFYFYKFTTFKAKAVTTSTLLHKDIISETVKCVGISLIGCKAGTILLTKAYVIN